MAWFLFNVILFSLFAGIAGGPGSGHPARVILAAPAAQAEEPAEAGPLPSPPRKLSEDSLGVVLTASSSALVDTASGEVLYAEGQDRIVPIASITKLMTATVFLDAHPDWDKRITIEADDDGFEGLPYLKVGETLTVRDLFYTALTGSVNTAALALARSTGMSRDAFVEKMNSEARTLGLTHSQFVDPSGYLPGNVSTAIDVARLAYFALGHDEIRDALTRKEYRFKDDKGTDRVIPATDELLSSFLNDGSSQIVGGKTGYTQEAGYTLVVRARQGKGDVIGVVLGSASSADRFQDVKSLLTWGFRTFEW